MDTLLQTVPNAKHRRGPGERSAQDEHVVIFTLGNENYGVDISQVWEINTMPEITRIPKAPRFIEGVINLRGDIVPVMSLRKRLGLPEKEYDRDSRVMVVQAGEHRLGLVVDSVREVLKIPGEVIEPPAQFTTLIEEEFLRGIAKREDCLVVLLDLELMLDGSEQTEIEQMQMA